MKTLSSLYTLSLLCVVQSVCANTVIWTAVFDDVEPRKPSITKEYCLAHTPTVMQTTIDQVKSEHGVTTTNKLRVKYLSYTQENKDGLLFNTVNAVVSGVDKKGKPWSTPMKMYQQTLSEQDEGKTWVVWSTPECKGSLIGTPTILP